MKIQEKLILSSIAYTSDSKIIILKNMFVLKIARRSKK
jgi:hypothetical protein